jgi:hypothetical protein
MHVETVKLASSILFDGEYTSFDASLVCMRAKL